VCTVVYLEIVKILSTMSTGFVIIYENDVRLDQCFEIYVFQNNKRKQRYKRLLTYILISSFILKMFTYLLPTSQIRRIHLGTPAW
jgi:hypothetical protein